MSQTKLCVTPVSYTHLDVYKRQVFRSSVHDATVVIPTTLVVERKTRIRGNVRFGSHETEFEEWENYLSQGRPHRSPGRVLLQRRVASSGRTGLRRGSVARSVPNYPEHSPLPPSSVAAVTSFNYVILVSSSNT